MSASGPLLVIPTKRGAVPNLTTAQANAILEPSERVVATSVFEAADFVKPCTESRMSISQYCGLDGYRIVLTLRSSFQGGHSSAASTDAAVAGDNERGRVVVTVDKWREVVKATKPDMAVELYESTPLSEPMNKRRRVAATRADTWHRQTQETVEAGCVLLPSISADSGHSAGYVDAVPRNENSLEYFCTLQALKLTGQEPSMCFVQSVAALVAAMVSNVSLIECPLPWALAEKGIAIVFMGNENDATTGRLLDFNDGAFALDIAPIAHDCPCYTCQRHNRAYLHHLLTVQEMNSEILLTIHNLSQVVGLLRTYRSADAAGREALARRVLSVF